VAPLWSLLGTAGVSALQLPLFAPSPTAWQPPTGPMNLDGVTQLCVDVERRDEQLLKLGSGTFRGAYVVGVALGTGDGRRAYYPIRHEGGGNCGWDVIGWLKRDLPRYDGQLVGANVAYDLEALEYEHQITLDNVTRVDDVITA
jgi:Mesyanzhinovviridae DNA polymerase